MTLIVEGPRSKNVWGKDIEPDYIEAGQRRPLPPAAGQGVKITGLSKSFGDVRVLTDLDLTIAPGQFVAIVGKSGCGKSTLLRLLAGLDAPDAGSIAFTDGGGAAVAPQSRIVFQEPRLLPWERVTENVEVGLGSTGTRADRRSRALLALEAVQLSEKSGEWPAKLSGGQRQRVALARALVSQPGFLALDEPLGALDALTRITMQGLVERVWTEQRFTAVFVTHDVAEAVALADRVIVLDQGRVALDIAVTAARPRSRGAADLAAIEQQLLDAIFGSRAV